ncbi:MAG: hypothetical protein U0237_11245 [Thermoleophilia bacterium]
MLSRHIATWPLGADRRRTLFALELLGWAFRLEPAAADGPGWAVRAGAGGPVRRCRGATPDEAVERLLSVLAEHEVLEPGWHVIARRPGRREPLEVATMPSRDDAMVRGVILLGRRIGTEVFVVRFGEPLAITEIMREDPLHAPRPETVPADERDR